MGSDAETVGGHTSLALFAVHVKSHGTSWRVLVRAENEQAARSSVEARGHVVVKVEPGERPGAAGNQNLSVCPVCNYALEGLAPGQKGYVQCPECGTVPTSLAESTFDAFKQIRARNRSKANAWRLSGVGLAMGVVILVLMLLLR